MSDIKANNLRADRAQLALNKLREAGYEDGCEIIDFLGDYMHMFYRSGFMHPEEHVANLARLARDHYNAEFVRREAP